MPEQISPAEYYEQIVPQQFAAMLASAGPEVADQPELTATYEITGAGGGRFGLRISAGTLDGVPGGIEASDMRTIVSSEHWRRTTTSDTLEPIVDYASRRKIQAIKGLSGALKLDLTLDDGSGYEGMVIFGGVTSPEVTIQMAYADYLAMMRGQLNGQIAFLQGKLQFEGSLPFLMQLNVLSTI